MYGSQDRIPRTHADCQLQHTVYAQVRRIRQRGGAQLRLAHREADKRTPAGDGAASADNAGGHETGAHSAMEQGSRATGQDEAATTTAESQASGKEAPAVITSDTTMATPRRMSFNLASAPHRHEAPASVVADARIQSVIAFESTTGDVAASTLAESQARLDADTPSDTMTVTPRLTLRQA